MKLNSKLLFVLICVFIVVNMLDGFTAFFISEAESNPVYIMTGSMWYLILLKVLVSLFVLYVYFKNKYPSRYTLFIFIYILIIGTLALTFGMIGNIYGMQNPDIVADGAITPEQTKLGYYGVLVSIMILIPYILASAGFKLYESVEKSINYDKK